MSSQCMRFMMCHCAPAGGSTCGGQDGGRRCEGRQGRCGQRPAQILPQVPGMQALQNHYYHGQLGKGLACSSLQPSCCMASLVAWTAHWDTWWVSGFERQYLLLTSCWTQAWKPERAHHDSVLGRCVLKMDHYWCAAQHTFCREGGLHLVGMKATLPLGDGRSALACTSRCQCCL